MHTHTHTRFYTGGPSKTSRRNTTHHGGGKGGGGGGDDDDDGISSNGSPRTVALRHFKDDRLLQSARLLRSYCLDDFDVSSSEEEEESSSSSRRKKEKEKEKEKERLVAYVLQKAKQSESFMDMLREDAEKDASWETQKSLSFSLTSSLSSSSSQKSREQTKIYYKTIENDTKLIVRVDQSIKRDMLVPVLATLNESQLYASWLPSWTMPKLKFSRTEKLDQRADVRSFYS